MVLDKDVAIPVRDGAVLRANVFRPDAGGRFPVLMTLGPYGKDVHLSQFMPEAWEALKRRHPEILKASSCKYLVFETPDPEMWAPHGYAVVKVDSRGSGKSPGKLDVNSPAEFRDFHDAIEWAAVQPWSSDKVGLLGISYYAAGQWMIAAERPPHLAAILPWQGTYDFYRDRTRQGGILGSGFLKRWWNRSVLRNQHGNPDTPLTDLSTGERNTGPESLAPAELATNRVEYIDNLLERPLNGPWYEERSARLDRIAIPALVVANWGGLGLHLRGTILGYLGIASREKWLKVQSGSYFLTFLQPESVALQRKFFDRYLRNIDNGWEREPKVEVAVRAFDPQAKEITFLSAVEPKAPVSQGWLRVSQRKLDPKRSTEWQPWHTHDQAQKLKPGEVVEVDLEIWPASLSLPAGYRLALTLQGKDFERSEETGVQKGSGWFLHDDPRDRPPETFAGTPIVYSGGGRASYLLLAVTGEDQPRYAQ